jgi:hypothetical protein
MTQIGRLKPSIDRTDRITYTVLHLRAANAKEFVDCWDRIYSGYGEEFYQRNIGKPLTAKRISQWFEWKNGAPLSQRKARALLRYSSPRNGSQRTSTTPCCTNTCSGRGA